MSREVEYPDLSDPRGDEDGLDDATPLPEVPTLPLPKLKGPKWYDVLVLKMKKEKIASKFAWIVEILIAVFAPQGRVGLAIAQFLKKAAELIDKKPTAAIIPPEGGTMKPGIKTTEFWMVLISNLITIIGALNGIIPAEAAAIIVAALTGLYGVLRALVKQPSITTLVGK